LKNPTPAEATKPRSRRLRKKLHIGEFQEWGFSIEIRLTPGEESTFDQALDAWLGFVETHGWAFGGGGSVDERNFNGFVSRSDRGSLTEEDHQIAETWLKETLWVKEGTVGPLQDA
jgi:hypothetical protein